MKIIILILVAIITFGLVPAQAYDTAPRISDREIVERLTTLEQKMVNLEQGQQAILREIDKRFEAMDQRFEAMDKRFEAMDQRFAQVQALIIGILVAFTSLVAVTISFAIWDRRTAVKPVDDRVDKLSIDFEKYKNKFETFLENLRKQAETDDSLAAVLRSITFL